MSLVVSRPGLDYCKPLTTSLQSADMDVAKAYLYVSSVVSALEEVRNDVEKVHKEWFARAGRLAVGMIQSHLYPGVWPMVDRCTEQM